MKFCFSYFAVRGYQLLRMYVCQIPVKLDRNASLSKTELGFRRVEKAEHQGCCGRIPLESGWNRNPAVDSGTPNIGTKAGMCNLADQLPSQSGWWSGRSRRQKGVLRVRQRRQRRRCEGVDNNGGGCMDFADAELMEYAGDVAPPPSLGISRGAPPSRWGGRRRRRRRRLCWRLRLVVASPHVAPPPPLVLLALRRLLSADTSPPVCLLHASPPIYLLFACWLSRRPCCPATSASRLCLDLFFAIWLSQLTRPHLSHRRRLSSSSRLCLAMRRLRILTRCRLTTGCVVAVADAQTSLPSMRRRLCRRRNCECRPW